MTKRIPNESVDLTKENINKIKELFPEVLTDGEKIDFDLLKTLLGEEVEDNNERYSFNWHGKKESILGAQKPSKGTLRPIKEKSKNFDDTENVYIEGDNLETLKLLQKSYSNKVKMIYIDPPYNTGNDFVYKDDFRNGVNNYLKFTDQADSEGNQLSTNLETNGRYHTDWLNMMYPRLKLAKNLLMENGVIFISIDENEMYNLKKISDEIFGEDNFIGMFVINSSPSAIDYGHMAKTNEYVLFYAKDIKKTEAFELPEENKKFKYRDQKGEFNIYPLYNGNVAFNPDTRPNLYYPFYLNPNSKLDNDFYEISLQNKEGWIEVYPVISRKDGIQRVWRWGKEKASKNINDEIVGYKTEQGEYRVVQKTRLVGKAIRALQLDTEVSSRRGTGEVEQLFNKKVFSFPKPVELIRRFMEISTKNNDLIIDFFSGSATTAHALFKMNAKDNFKRKFLMIQLPEILEANSIASEEGFRTICDIGEERIRRAGEKVKQDLIEKNNESNLFEDELVDPDRLDIGFKVFKLDTSNILEWNSDFDNLEQNLDLFEKVFVEGRDELDVVYEIMLKNGLELTYPVNTFLVNDKNIYDIASGNLFVCLDDEITLDIAQAIVDKRKEYGIETSTVVFKDAGFAGNDSDKLNVVQLLKDAGYPEDNILAI